MKKNELKKRAMTPAEVEMVYGIPRGSLANLRVLRRGAKYYKVGSRRVMYMVEDLEEWLLRNPVLTSED